MSISGVAKLEDHLDDDELEEDDDQDSESESDDSNEFYEAKPDILYEAGDDQSYESAAGAAEFALASRVFLEEELVKLLAHHELKLNEDETVEEIAKEAFHLAEEMNAKKMWPAKLGAKAALRIALKKIVHFKYKKDFELSGIAKIRLQRRIPSADEQIARNKALIAVWNAAKEDVGLRSIVMGLARSSLKMELLPEAFNRTAKGDMTAEQVNDLTVNWLFSLGAGLDEKHKVLLVLMLCKSFDRQSLYAEYARAYGLKEDSSELKQEVDNLSAKLKDVFDQATDLDFQNFLRTQRIDGKEVGHRRGVGMEIDIDIDTRASRRSLDSYLKDLRSESGTDKIPNNPKSLALRYIDLVKAKSGDFTARNNFARTALRLCVSLVKKMNGNLNDNIAQANIALLEKAVGYDFRTGFSMTTYMARWIGQVADRRTKEDRDVHMPIHTVEYVNRFKRFKWRNPELEMSEALDQFEKLYGGSKMIQKMKQGAFLDRSYSLDKPIDEDEESTFGDVVADKSEMARFGEIVEQVEFRDKVEMAVDCLPPFFAVLMRLRMGMIPGHENEKFALKQVGNIFGLSRERIRQFEEGIFNTLKSLSLDDLHDLLRVHFYLSNEKMFVAKLTGMGLADWQVEALKMIMGLDAGNCYKKPKWSAMAEELGKRYDVQINIMTTQKALAPLLERISESPDSFGLSKISLFKSIKYCRRVLDSVCHDEPMPGDLQAEINQHLQLMQGAMQKVDWGKLVDEKVDEEELSEKKRKVRRESRQPGDKSRSKKNLTYSFDHLEERPDKLKAYMLEKLRVGRAALSEAGDFKYRDNQIEALDKFEAFLQDPEFGLVGHVVQPTGAGKTVLFGILLKLIDLPSIVLVPDANLLIQIKEELVKTLKIDENDIGILDGTHKEFGKKFVIATYAVHNALCRKRNADYQRQIKKTSLMICDEAHDALGKNTTERVNEFEAVDNSFVRVGFTATPKLLAKHVSDHFGKEIASTTFAEQVAKKVLVPMRLIEVRANILASELNGTEITEKNETNVVERERIFERTLEEFLVLKERVESEGKKLITATYLNRVAHAHRYAEMAKEYGLKSEVVVADGGASDEFRERIKRIEADLQSGVLDMVIAVGKMAQGWDFVPLNCVILAAPMASPKKIIQRIGRGLRAANGKDCCYVIAPNFRIRKSKSGGRFSSFGQRVLRGFDKERMEGGDYSLGDNISVLDSLLDHGESQEGLDSFCKVIKENKNDHIDNEYDQEPHLGFLDKDFPLAYFDKYFENPERIRTDLEGLAEALAVPKIEYLRLCHFKGQMLVLANGEKVDGEEYLRLSAYILADKDIRPRKGLYQLKMKLGIVIPSLTDRAYFTPERIRADLDLVKFLVSPLRDSYMRFYSSDLYREEERVVSASTYLIKVKQALGLSMKHGELFHWLTKYAAGVVQLPPPPKNYVPYVPVVPQVKKPAFEIKPTPEIKPVVEVKPEAPVKHPEPEIVVQPVVKIDELRSETNSDLRSLLENLTAEQQKIGTAILIEGKSAKEASQELGMPLGKVMMVSARVKMLIERSAETE